MSGVLCAHVAGRRWELLRPADLERLWADFPEDDPAAEDRIPYWVELWPAAVGLAWFVAREGAALQGLRCLDVGCGLGLSSMVAAWCGAQVVGMDLIHDALTFARRNAVHNAVPAAPGWVAGDWNHPPLRPQSFTRIWGADILYETRFFPALEGLFRRLLAPGGRVWLADPDRAVSRPVWDRFRDCGWRVVCRQETELPWYGKPSLVRIWELQPKGD
ncbi:MAG: methyltransferase domain-containing protein [Desulfomicrobiaceae bacterium]